MKRVAGNEGGALQADQVGQQEEVGAGGRASGYTGLEASLDRKDRHLRLSRITGRLAAKLAPNPDDDLRARNRSTEGGGG
jgi:hypothetical protein